MLDDLKYILKLLFQIEDTALSALDDEATPRTFSLFDLVQKDQEPSSSTSSTAGHAVKIIDLPLALLFHEFHQALLKFGFFNFVFGKDYIARKQKTKNLFKNAIQVLRDIRGALNYENLVEGLRSLGMKEMVERNYNKAIEYYTCTIAMCNSTNSDEHFLNRAAAFIKVGRIHDAIDDYCDATKANPSNINAYLDLGALYIHQQNYLAAICQSFIKVLQLEPDNQVALDQLLAADIKLKEQLDWKDEQLPQEERRIASPISSKRGWNRR
ncbi:hypothetical protein L6164_032493 [Bauhinia variegata]|uniref:Uncharacterized protein n=1 Tax=Bauhinia variegata TaxID=167791 RepID=A0ACB9KPP6_BAUVA|nr:hypothetical protein L6164_032493 [Bauhinia variegata]